MLFPQGTRQTELPVSRVLNFLSFSRLLSAVCKHRTVALKGRKTLNSSSRLRLCVSEDFKIYNLGFMIHCLPIMQDGDQQCDRIRAKE